MQQYQNVTVLFTVTVLFMKKTCHVEEETQVLLSAQYHQIDVTMTSLTIMEMAPDIKCSGREVKSNRGFYSTLWLDDWVIFLHRHIASCDRTPFPPNTLFHNAGGNVWETKHGKKGGSVAALCKHFVAFTVTGAPLGECSLR